MARTNRTAFTLVEMLVVIVIISMLVALLVPAVIGARARARRASCMNRMNQTGKAILQYESAKGHLPGYVNKIGTAKFAGSVASSNNLSWVVVILENLGRADLWKEWRKKPPTGVLRESDPNFTVVLNEVVCPSDTERRGKQGALSFAVNCGISDVSSDVLEYVGVAPKAYSESAWGLFFDHDTTNGLPGGGSQTVTIGLDEIGDGAQQTIMLSENLNAGSWSSPLAADAAGAIPQRQVGVVWWSTAGSLPWTGSVPGQVAINSETNDARFKARPSSNHPGGVNAVMADGHSEFISDRVDYGVFCEQMISNQTKAKALFP
jgi:prepilin-type N-terminal cleavage/methylation domain-containing protein/prepilin-type processing-associated H-X9-DG protein